MRPSYALLLAIVAALLVGCGRDEAGSITWHELDEARATERQRAQQEQARSACDALFRRLSTRLFAAMDAGGPEGALGVCRDEALGMTAEVGRREDVRIGRTAVRLRNPANAPPDWARHYVDRETAQPVWLARADGTLAALIPIFLKQPCLVCHGPPEDIPPEVSSRLAELYPEDRATGFETGSLRGWFWVEVP